MFLCVKRGNTLQLSSVKNKYCKERIEAKVGIYIPYSLYIFQQKTYKTTSFYVLKKIKLNKSILKIIYIDMNF